MLNTLSSILMFLPNLVGSIAAGLAAIVLSIIGDDEAV